MPRRRFRQFVARRRLREFVERFSFDQLPRPPIGDAMRRAFRDGYSLASLRADLMSGLVVSLVALPLSMALALAIGAPAERGLTTAIIGGGLIALLGGSRLQVSGPTAAFIVILAPIVTAKGISGLLMASMLAGLICIGMGLMRFGRLIQFIPHPVTTGFTTGVAVVIATLQIKDALGLNIPKMPESYVEKIEALYHARHSFHWHELVIALVTLGLLIILPRIVKKIPAPLIAIGAVSLATALLHKSYPNFTPHTIAAIPRSLPSPSVPWHGAGISWGMIRELMPAAFAIAMLGAIESLLSAVVVDAMTGDKHDPDAELIALGVGNLVVPFFGGIPVTGALARTTTNVRGGGRTPMAAVFNALFILLAVLLAAPLMSHVPLASLAGLLMLVAWNMSEVRHFRHILAIAPKSDVAILITCFGLTVFFDMAVAVSVGVMLTALSFMQRMAESTSTKFSTADSSSLLRPLPKQVVLYEIAGPLFFGAAQRATDALTQIGGDAVVVILDLARATTIDATGFVALESALARLLRDDKHVIIAGPLPEPRRVFDRAHLDADEHVVIAANLDAAITLAEGYLRSIGIDPAAGPPSSRRILAM